jgi:hypothetical protein
MRQGLGAKGLENPFSSLPFRYRFRFRVESAVPRLPAWESQ